MALLLYWLSDVCCKDWKDTYQNNTPVNPENSPQTGGTDRVLSVTDIPIAVVQVVYWNAPMGVEPVIETTGDLKAEFQVN